MSDFAAATNDFFTRTGSRDWRLSVRGDLKPPAWPKCPTRAGDEHVFRPMWTNGYVSPKCCEEFGLRGRLADRINRLRGLGWRIQSAFREESSQCRWVYYPWYRDEDLLADWLNYFISFSESSNES